MLVGKISDISDETFSDRAHSWHCFILVAIRLLLFAGFNAYGCLLGVAVPDAPGGVLYVFVQSSFLYLRRSEQQVPAASPKFMIISGSTAGAEMCLTAETDGVQAAGVGSWCGSVSPQMRLAMAESFSVGRMVKL